MMNANNSNRPLEWLTAPWRSIKSSFYWVVIGDVYECGIKRQNISSNKIQKVAPSDGDTV